MDGLRELPQAFVKAWARHNGHELAQMMAEDVDFVTVGATWLHGRADFEKYHSRLLSGRFKDSTIIPLDKSVRFLRRGLGVVHWSWTIKDDRNGDGSLRPQRFGLMMMVAQKRDGRWLVVLAQNTNASPEMPPEAKGIDLPIRIPQSSPNTVTPKK